MRLDTERRKKVLEETTFVSKADVKFTKPAPKGGRKLVSSKDSNSKDT